MKINNENELVHRKPLFVACAVISVFIILTASYIDVSSKKDAEKGLNNKNTDKGYNYLSFGPLEFVYLFESLNYSLSSFSLVDKEDLLIPQLPVPCETIATQIYKKDEYKYICIGNINNKKFAMTVQFTELEVEEGKEWFEVCDNKGLTEVEIRGFNGTKYIKSVKSDTYKFYKDGIVIYCYFTKLNGEPLSFSEQLELVANTTFVKPIFTEKNNVKLMYKGIDDKVLKIDEKEKSLKYNYTEIDLSKGYIANIYNDEEKYYYFSEQSDEIISKTNIKRYFKLSAS